MVARQSHHLTLTYKIIKKNKDMTKAKHKELIKKTENIIKDVEMLWDEKEKSHAYIVGYLLGWTKALKIDLEKDLK